MNKKELKNKKEVMNLFIDWLNDFTDNTLFDISINHESSISVQMPYTKEYNKEVE